MKIQLNKSIFVIEDDSYIRSALTDVLADQGYMVIGADNGERALEMLTQCDDKSLPGLILLDLMMPVMDGYHFRREQMKVQRLARIPTFLLSAADNLRSSCKELQLDGFIKKPIDLDRLLDLIQTHCGKH